MEDLGIGNFEGITRTQYYQMTERIPDQEPDEPQQSTPEEDNVSQYDPSITMPTLSQTQLRAMGACSDVPTEVFFPEKKGSTKPAKAICRQCIVREECLEYAIVTQSKQGVFGGEAPRRREIITKQRKSNS